MRKYFWWLIIGIKLIVSYFPILQELLRKAGFYSPGNMDKIGYAVSCYFEHVEKAQVNGAKLNLGKVVELGPGGSNLSALIGGLQGVEETILIDLQKINKTLELEAEENYHEIRKKLKTENPRGFESIKYKYFQYGLKSFQYIESDSVDYLWSHVVLQHVSLQEFPSLISELHRVCKDGAIMSHKVDFKDCICAGLNNMRFSDDVWNSIRFQRSGFYTNRLRRNDMLKYFEREGFRILKVEDNYFEKSPIKWEQCSADIKNRYTPQDLEYSGSHFICQKISK